MTPKETQKKNIGKAADDVIAALQPLSHTDLKEHYPLPYSETQGPHAYTKRLPSQKRFVFCNPDGSMVKSFKKSFYRAVKRAGLKNASIHTMRHSYASHLLMAGVDPKSVQTLLGHKSIKITMDTYGHLSTSHLESAVKKLPYRKAQSAKVIALQPRTRHPEPEK